MNTLTRIEKMSLKMWQLPLVYVGGPYTRPDPVYNTHLAIHHGERLQSSGLVTCYVPHVSLLTHIVAPHTDLEYWYEYDLTILKRSDAMFRFPGDSTGADREVAFAEEQGIPVFFTEAHVLQWAGDQ